MGWFLKVVKACKVLSMLRYGNFLVFASIDATVQYGLAEFIQASDATNPHVDIYMGQPSLVEL
jgi:hypothetical protein